MRHLFLCPCFSLRPVNMDRNLQTCYMPTGNSYSFTHGRRCLDRTTVKSSIFVSAQASKALWYGTGGYFSDTLEDAYQSSAITCLVVNQ